MEEIRRLHKENPNAQIEVYMQATMSVSANIGYSLASEGIKVQFGQWLNGTYHITPNPVFNSSTEEKQHNPITQQLEHLPDNT